MPHSKRTAVCYKNYKNNNKLFTCHNLDMKTHVVSPVTTFAQATRDRAARVYLHSSSLTCSSSGRGSWHLDEVVSAGLQKNLSYWYCITCDMMQPATRVQHFAVRPKKVTAWQKCWNKLKGMPALFTNGLSVFTMNAIVQLHWLATYTFQSHSMYISPVQPRWCT